VIKFAHLVSIAVIILSIAPTYFWYSIWLPICGVTALTTLISANSYVQTRSDPAIRGRVMGIYLLIFLGGTPFGSLLIGWMTETIGVRETVAACGGISLTAALVIWAIYKDKVEEPEDLRVSTVLK
jgi:MFS family permease